MKSRKLIVIGALGAIAAASLFAFAQNQDPAEEAVTDQSDQCNIQMNGMTNDNESGMQGMMPGNTMMEKACDMMNENGEMSEECPMNDSQMMTQHMEMKGMEECDMEGSLCTHGDDFSEGKEKK